MSRLVYTDRLYGTAVIDEPLLLDLMASRAMQRLRGVLQHGITGLIGITAPTSRFEHSVGVMLIVRRLGGSLAEQAAALLHDVSHTAFSHVIDYVVNSHSEQAYHDQVKADYVATTDLPAVLAAHGLNWRDLIEEGRFPLLEQPAPALCADRLDYFLRDACDLGLITPGAVRHAIARLVVHEGRIVTDDLAVARWMADAYMRADDRSWSDFREVGLYELTAQAIRRALASGAIRQEDFWSTDAALWDRLHTSADPALRALLALVSPETRFEWDAGSPDFVLTTKIRTLDPDVLVNGTARPLSVLDADFAAHREAYLRRKGGRWPFRVIAAV